jgi:putative ABC transport system permease protein
VVLVLALDKLGTEGQVSNILVRGVTSSAVAVRPEVRIVEGRAANPGTDEAIVGRGVVGRFTGLELGGAVDLSKNRPVNVVGVFEAGGSSIESEVWADIDTVRSSMGRGSSSSSVTVRLESPAAFDGFAATIENDKQLGLAASRENVYYEKQSEGTSIFITGLGATIAFFFSLGAMIGAMITMYGAVSQRSKEVGTLLALGFSPFTVVCSFLFEATIRAGAGGLLGALGSLAMAGF